MCKSSNERSGPSRFAGRRAAPRAAGFTLVEVIVAFTILAIALVALMQAFSGGLRGLSAVESQALALAHARTKLEEVGVTMPLAPGAFEDEFDDGYRWRVTIAPSPTQPDSAFAAPALQLYAVQVEITPGRGGTGGVTLNSLRLGAPP